MTQTINVSVFKLTVKNLLMLNQILLILFSLSLLSAQTIAPEVTEEKKRLLVLAADKGIPDDAIDRKVSKIVAEVASKLGRYEVIDRNQLKSILNELALQRAGFIDEKNIIELGGIASAKEAMKVQINHYSQKGVPPKDNDDDDDDRGFWEMLVYESVKGVIRMATTPEEEEPYANNMETIIQADIILLNIETGITINIYPISGTHTGGSRGKSLGIALDVLKNSIVRSLKEMYVVQSEILEAKGSKVTLLLGSDLGVDKGTIYEISRLDKKRTIGEREIIIPGRTVGLVRINRSSGDASMGTVIRKWGRVKTGYQAKEMLDPPRGSIGFSLRLNHDEQRIDHGDILFQINPLSRWGGFFYLGGGSIFDSRNDMDGVFSVGGGFIYRFFYTPQFNLGGVVDLPFLFVNRDDDFGHSVSTILLAPQLGLQTEIMINRKLDFVIRGGISSPGSYSTWDYTEGEGEDVEWFDAEWDERGEPALDASGMYINFSIRYLDIKIDY
ncbi:MAG TPA: hypothetical protein DD389_02360 [Candidatus Marinimicrobia bacterium]|nr:hypothetical protein [Candidatus Neomarinimicrobiota bacterium]